MLSTVQELAARGVQVRFVKEALTFDDTSNPCNELMLTIMAAAVAQFERSLILERQREGIAIAKAAGKYTGRKPSLTSVVAARLSVGDQLLH